ncbi:MAG: 5-formyltetrahydrofolate cyclo-ligase [Muribaculaceae bacterium]|nr:5-formyltetrahydrofolate cyclo-ligase [Muribaculaceae bacterium]
MKKEDIRARMRNQKSLLTEAERNSAAEAVFALLEKMTAFILADRVLLYNSLPDELSTRAFLDKWHGRKRMYLPRVNGIDLDILPYERTRTHLGAFHIEEPDGEDVTDVADIDLIVVPAVAYDTDGSRVGRGKGYYDRLLVSSRAVKVGVAYDFQLLDSGSFDTEAHDVAMDYIITPGRFIRLRRTRG